MTKKISHRFVSFLGAGVLLGALASPGCSDSQDFSGDPRAKVTRDDIQKAEYERDKAAKAARSPRRAR